MARKTKGNTPTEAFEDGVLVGWYCQAAVDGEPIRVFIPRRAEDVEADRAEAEALSILFDMPALYAPLSEWLEYRDWLVATFGDTSVGASYIRDADHHIARIRRERGEL